MSNSDHLHREYSSTYFVQDRSNMEELQRLQIQDQMITAGMGGVLPELPAPIRFQRVLDVSCGTGGWLIDVARTYPEISLLIGVDINSKILDHARKQARIAQVSNRTEFHMMDALLFLEFPDKFFDLVNHRLCLSYLRTWDWSKLLHEYRRVACPGATIRITECNALVESNSPALSLLYRVFVQALYNAGHFFTEQGDGVISHLVGLLERHGFSNVQARAFTLHPRAGTSEWQSFYEDIRHFFRTIQPFLRKWARLPNDYEGVYQQMLKEMQQPDFAAQWHFLTAWARNPLIGSSKDFFFVR